ncbi:MAG: response regulator transcription factor, partial [Gemmatimonadaceae bacterium]
YRVRTFGSGQEYLAESGSIHPTCILADIRMPGIDGLALNVAVHKDGSDVPTVFMTGTGDISTVVEAMKAGASDLLSKPFTVRALLSAIDAAVNRAHRSDVDHRELAALWRALTQLTPREAEVAALVASGRLNKQVAAALGITEKTVKVHRARAMRKLHAESLAELVRVVDRLLAEPRRRLVHVDGVDVSCPPTLDVMVRALTRASATKA